MARKPKNPIPTIGNPDTSLAAAEKAVPEPTQDSMQDVAAPEVEVKPERTWADFSDDEGILQEAKEKFKECHSGDSKNRDYARDDMEFLEQPWTQEALNTRRGKVCLNADPLAPFRNRVKNEFAKLEPGIKVRPFDSYGDPQTALKLEGLIRHIQDVSRAKTVFNHAQGQMVDTGQGWGRVVFDYVNEESFEQEIYIKRIVNRFCVVPGFFQEPDASDMEVCFITESVPRGDYADTKAAGHDWDAGDETLRPWFDEERMTIAEYWRIIKKPDTLCLMSNGMKIFESVLNSEEGKARLEEENAKQKAMGKPLIRVIRRRKVDRPYVQVFKLTAFDVLERMEWPGRWIPVFMFPGNQQVRPDGTVVWYGIVRNSKDQVRLINYFWSEEAEMVALQPKVPFIGTAEQFEGHEGEWDRAATGDAMRVNYNPHVIETTGGPLLVPKPERQQPPAVPSAMIQSRIGAMELLKGANGIYNAALGDMGPARSGRAILAEQAGSDSSTFHYVNGPEIGIQHCARIVIDLIRKVYTGPTVRRILGIDGSEEIVTFNAPKEGADGKPVLYDLSVGEYDVTVEMGPAYSTQRQEALSALQDVLKILPPDRQAVIADLVVGNIDAKDMDRAAARLKALLPPEVLKSEDMGGDASPEDMLAEAKQQLAQMQAQEQQMQQAMQMLQAQMAELAKKAEGAEADRELKWKQSLLDASVKMYQTDATANMEKMKLRIEELDKMVSAQAEEDTKASGAEAEGEQKSEADSGNG
jgi:hypothetical protein